MKLSLTYSETGKNRSPPAGRGAWDVVISAITARSVRFVSIRAGMKSSLSESGLGTTDVLRAALLRFFFLHPLNKQLLKLLLGVDSPMNHLPIHVEGGSLNRCISEGQPR